MTKKTTNFSPFKLLNVRLLYPSLFQPKVWNTASKPKYEATFLLNKERHNEEIKNINSIILNHLSQNNLTLEKAKLDAICFKDGDLSGKPEYENSYTLKAKSIFKFPIVHKDGKTLVEEEDNIFYGGCYVNVYVNLRTYVESAVGVSCNIKAIQFAGKGEPIGGMGPFNVDGKFDNLETEDMFF
jgi:Protein of unknown function (DUF2815)